MNLLYNLMVDMTTFKHWFVPPVPPHGEFRVNGIGVRELMSPCTINRPSGTLDYLFMYFYDGVTIEQGGIIATAPPRSFHVWEPGVRQYYGNASGPWNHSWIHCDGSLVGEQVREAQVPLNEVVSLGDPSLMEKHLLELHEELTTQSEPDPMIVKNLFQNMLHRLSRTIEGERDARSPKRIPERFLAMKKYMEAHFVEPLTLDTLAERAHLSVPHFCSEFRRYFEVSPVAYLIRLRMHAAAYHLRNVNYRVSEVAGLVGYDDIFYFSKLFKKRYGLSPRAMRTSMTAASSEAPPSQGG